MPKEEKRQNNMFIFLLLGVCIITIISSFYFFYFKKDYNFFIETQCNPETETCFYRDCNIPDNCPPNNLSYYNEYSIKAKDFKYCINEDCTLACALNTINCVKTECTSDDIESGICLEPSSINTQD